MAAYCFFDVLEVVDPAKLEKYRDGVLATVESHGGRYLTVGGRSEVVEGEWRPVFPVLIEFPSLDEAHRWYDSEEYRELKALRLAATRGNAVFIEGNGFNRPAQCPRRERGTVEMQGLAARVERVDEAGRPGYVLGVNITEMSNDDRALYLEYIGTSGWESVLSGNDKTQAIKSQREACDTRAHH